MGRLRRLAVFVALVVILMAGYGFLANYRVTRGHTIHRSVETIKPAEAVLVPGASVSAGRPSQMLRSRLERALEVYRANLAPRILLSGSGADPHYDEVSVMAAYLIRKGVNKRDILSDPYGLRTIDSLNRAREVFRLNQLIVVSQAYHLPRIGYIARNAGVNVQLLQSGEGAVSRANQFRELGARIRAFTETWLPLWTH